MAKAIDQGGDPAPGFRRRRSLCYSGTYKHLRGYTSRDRQSLQGRQCRVPSRQDERQSNLRRQGSLVDHPKSLRNPYEPRKKEAIRLYSGIRRKNTD